MAQIIKIIPTSPSRDHYLPTYSVLANINTTLSRPGLLPSVLQRLAQMSWPRLAQMFWPRLEQNALTRIVITLCPGRD